jgi:hypothetical protein
MYTIDWIGTVALGILQDGKPRFALALEDGQEIPQEFKVGDEVTVLNRPADPASVAMGVNYGSYDVTHIPSGKVVKIMHRAYEWMFK